MPTTTTDDPAYRDLTAALDQALGSGPAATLLELLPKVPTEDILRDVDHHERRLAMVEESMLRADSRFEDRMERLERRIDTRIDEKFASFEALWSERLEAMEQRLTASFRGELNAAVVSQTRTTIFTMAGTVLSLTAMMALLG